MASTSNTPAGSPDASTAQAQPSQPVSNSQLRPLQREGAFYIPYQSQPSQPASQLRPLQREGTAYILSSAEQALEDAMLRSSPPPEQVLGKRTHEEGDEQEDGDEPGGDTDLEERTSASAHAQSLAPSLANITDATLRYATYKKLRSEQRDKLEAFLQVSTLFTYFVPLSKH